MSKSDNRQVICNENKSAVLKEDKMKRRMRRRRRNSYRKEVNMTGKVLSVVIVIGFSVFAGYMTANYLIGPMLGLESEQVFSDFLNNEKEIEKKKMEEKQSVEKKTNVVQDKLETESETGFALQYGSFSAREGAEQCASQLKSQGIEADIIEKDGSYKVIGPVFRTREEAAAQKNASTGNKDIFITEIP